MNGRASRPQEHPSEKSCAVRLAVVHWFPLEQYPPARNLLNYFGDEPDFCVLACTTHHNPGRKTFAHNSVKVLRWTFPRRALSRLCRLCLFAGFPLFVLGQLVFFRPDVLLYFEPHSSFPAFLYLLLNRRCRLFIHYHEFRDQEEYRQPGNRLIALYHWFEKRWLYRRAVWISQTNDDRVRMFLEDYPDVDASKMRSLPNLPPKKWISAAKLRQPDDCPEDVSATLEAGQQAFKTAMPPNSRHATQQHPANGSPLRLVYVGAISHRDTLIKPLVEWICRRDQGDVLLDLFAGNIDSDTRHYLEGLCDPRIRFVPEGIDYDQLPDVLPRYDVGLILYRGNTRNYVYNAPNKLFEYLACGLDVWFPPTMLGVKPFARSDMFPQVIEVDFVRLDDMPVSQLLVRSELMFESFDLRCEDVLSELKEAIMGAVVSTKTGRSQETGDR